MNSVRFSFHGRTAFAVAAPHMGISALDAVELMNLRDKLYEIEPESFVQHAN